MKIDLHTHTNFSACANKENGWFELLCKAEKEKINILSITDHNTCLFHLLEKFVNITNFSGRIVPGIELDVVEDGVSFELLAYNFDVKKIFDWSFEKYGTIHTRQLKLKDKLVEAIKCNNLEIDEKNLIIGKTDYAHKSVYDNMIKFSKNCEVFEKYNIKNSSDFYRVSTENKGFPVYVDTKLIWPDVSTVVNAIHNANGVVVLAHPYNYKDSVNVENLLKIAVEKGLDGIEVFHPSCNNEQAKYLLDFANKNNLIVTGGSDYHGTEKHNVLGLSEQDSNTVCKSCDLIIKATRKE